MRPRESGFTVMELLLAMAIMSFIAVGVAGVMRGNFNLYRTATRQLALDQEARKILHRIGRDFENAISVPGRTWQVYPDGVAFCTVDPGVAHVRYRVRTHATETPASLEREAQELNPLQRLQGITTRYQKFPLALEWEYAFPAEGTEEPLRWEKIWKATDRLPPGIRVSLTLWDHEAQPHVFRRALVSPVRELRR